MCHVTKVLSGDDAVPELFQQRCTATFRKRTDVVTRKTLRMEKRNAADENFEKVKKFEPPAPKLNPGFARAPFYPHIQS